MPEFQNPFGFLLLLLIPLFYFLRKAGFFKRLSFYYTISNWDGKPFLWNKKGSRFLEVFADFLLLSSYVFFVLAFSEPVVYRQEKVFTSRGTDVVFVLDVSPSMAARDFSGERRMDVAKKAISDLVKVNQGVSYGLVTMAGEAFVSVSATMDYDFFLKRLYEVNIGSLGDGTALGIGLCTAVYHLESSSAPKKCIILVTDGENNSGAIHPETASVLAFKNGITVYTLGVGTNGSVPIDYVDPKTGKNYSGYLNSTFDSKSLREIASSGGGRYFEIRSLPELSFALSVISRNENTSQSYHTKTTGKDYYSHLLFVSIVLVILGWSIKRIYLKEYL